MLRHRRPVSHPFPNAYSHPLPRFSYEQETRQITVTFTCDPSYPSSASGRDAAVSAWKDNTYMMAALPIRKPRTILDDATALLSNAISSPLSLFGGHSAPANTRPHEVFDDGDIDLREDEILEQERAFPQTCPDALDPDLYLSTSVRKTKGAISGYAPIQPFVCG